MNENQKRIYLHKTLINYKNQMIWLINNDYSKQRKMIIAKDIFSRTLNKLEKVFAAIKDVKDFKSPLDT